MNVDDRLKEIQKKIIELDSLIGDTLDNEPETDQGEYGKKIRELFEKANWIEASIY